MAYTGVSLLSLKLITAAPISAKKLHSFFSCQK